MEFVAGFVVGFFLLPWYWMSILTLLFVVDVVLVESDCFGWTTTSLLAGLGLAAYFGADVNPFMWVWANVGNILEFFVLFWGAGALWSVIKWYLYLLKVRDRARRGDYLYGHRVEPHDKIKRPSQSYAKNNKYKIMGWIAYWPFSMVGSIFGDFLSRIVKSIYRFLSSLYEAIGNSVMSEFED